MKDNDWFDMLKQARMSKGLSLRQLEDRTGISNGYISQIENKQIEDPSFFKMIKLFNACGVLISWKVRRNL